MDKRKDGLISLKSFFIVYFTVKDIIFSTCEVLCLTDLFSIVVCVVMVILQFDEYINSLYIRFNGNSFCLIDIGFCLKLNING